MGPIEIPYTIAKWVLRCKFGSDLCFSLSYAWPLHWALLSLSFSLHLDLTMDPILPRGSSHLSADPSGSDPRSLRDGHRIRPIWDPTRCVARILHFRKFPETAIPHDHLLFLIYRCTLLLHHLSNSYNPHSRYLHPSFTQYTHLKYSTFFISPLHPSHLCTLLHLLCSIQLLLSLSSPILSHPYSTLHLHFIRSSILIPFTSQSHYFILLHLLQLI
jgi:hypothetical protein